MTKIAFSRLGKRGRTTLPKEVRQALRLKAGDTVVYTRANNNTVRIARAKMADHEYLIGIESILTEWASADDAKAYDKLYAVNHM